MIADDAGFHGLFEYGVGQPGGGRYGNGIGAKYPFADMEVGDWFLVALSLSQTRTRTQDNLRVGAGRFWPKKFVTRKHDDGHVRVERAA